MELSSHGFRSLRVDAGYRGHCDEAWPALRSWMTSGYVHPQCRDIWRVNDASHLEFSCQNDDCVYVQLVIPVLFCFLGPDQHPSFISFDNAHVTVGSFYEISVEAERHAEMVWGNNLHDINMAVSLNAKIAGEECQSKWINFVIVYSSTRLQLNVQGYNSAAIGRQRQRHLCGLAGIIENAR